MPDSGTLVTRVFTGRSQLPVQDASVSVVQHQTDGEHLLDIQASDRSGNTAPLPIQTPALQSSQSPGTNRPFAVCDIWVEHPGYQLLLIQNVQLFSGVVSIQELPLVPLSATERAIGTVTISPQDL